MTGHLSHGLSTNHDLHATVMTVFASIYRTFQVNVYENFKQAFALYRFGGDIKRMRDCKNLWPIHFGCSHNVPC